MAHQSICSRCGRRHAIPGRAHRCSPRCSKAHAETGRVMPAGRGLKGHIAAVEPQMLDEPSQSCGAHNLLSGTLPFVLPSHSGLLPGFYTACCEAPAAVPPARSWISSSFAKPRTKAPAITDIDSE